MDWITWGIILGIIAFIVFMVKRTMETRGDEIE